MNRRPPFKRPKRNGDPVPGYDVCYQCDGGRYHGGYICDVCQGLGYLPRLDDDPRHDRLSGGSE